MSSCACVYVYVCSEGIPSFHNEKYVKARKEHYCDECGRTIKKNEHYEYVSGSWNGDFDVFKTCEDCLSIRGELFCDGWNYRDVWEDVGEHISNVGDDVLSCDIKSLTRPARDKLLDMVEERWDDD